MSIFLIINVKIIEFFNAKVNKYFDINTNTDYFNCTNFYFEINEKNNFRRNGLSKENKKDPIIGIDLLLNSNIILIDMSLYSNNKSKKPILREIINDSKDKHDIINETLCM